MRPLLLCLGLLLAPLASLAQGAPDGVDAFQTDGGTGGWDEPPDDEVDPGGEEGDDNTGRVVTRCHSSRDCSPRFTCKEGRCRYTGVRQAERVGCLLGPEAALVLVGLTLAAAHRREKE